MDRLETEDERWFRINIENRYYREMQKKYCPELTIDDIYEAFPEECNEIVGKIYKLIVKELNDIKRQNEVLISQGIYIELKDKELLKRKKDLEAMAFKYELPGIKFAKNNTGNVIDLNKIKSVKITDLHSFDKIKKTGNKYMASCPFHKDNTPSMIINENNHFHCFSCGKNGSNIDFIMELNGMSFVESAKWINSKI